MPDSMKKQILPVKAIVRTVVGSYYLFDWPLPAQGLPRAVRTDTIKAGTYGPAFGLMIPHETQPVYEVLENPISIEVKL